MISSSTYNALVIIVKVSIFFSTNSIIYSQDVLNIKIVPFSDESWDRFKIRVNNNVDNGSITISQMEYILNGYRSIYKVRDFRHEKHDNIMKVNFDKHTNKSLGYIKNNLIDSGIEVEKLDAVLSGLLRLFHYSNKEGSNFRINRKMNSYFRKRLKLNREQVNYLIYMTQKYKTVKFE